MARKICATLTATRRHAAFPCSTRAARRPPSFRLSAVFHPMGEMRGTVRLVGLLGCLVRTSGWLPRPRGVRTLRRGAAMPPPIVPFRFAERPACNNRGGRPVRAAGLVFDSAPTWRPAVEPLSAKATGPSPGGACCTHRSYIRHPCEVFPAVRERVRLTRNRDHVPVIRFATICALSSESS